MGIEARTTEVDGVALTYETFGDPEDVPLLLIAGLGAQMISWDDAFCEGLVDRGFWVIRFDNRDVGRSTWIESDLDPVTEIFSMFTGQPARAPYTVVDMARDAVHVLDDLDCEAAHVVGRSMGGMIAQQVAIDYPERVLSLTSIMSTTGEPDVGSPNPDILPDLLKIAPDGHDEYIEHAVAQMKLIAAPDHFDHDIATTMAERAYARGNNPKGSTQQVLAILTSPSRAEGLATLSVPTLVFHGDLDPLVTISGGERTAELVPGAELVVLEGMAHDLPPAFWARIISGVTELASRAAV